MLVIRVHGAAKSCDNNTYGFEEYEIYEGYDSEEELEKSIDRK